MLPVRPYDLDDDLLDEVRAQGTTRVRVYPFEEIAVVIGRGGSQELELIPETITADGVPVFKRPGGGCSVVLDPGNLIIAVALPLPGIGNIKSAFKNIGDWIIDCLDRSGVPGVTQRGTSDLALGEMKIGGSCVYRTRNLIYYSTTLLVAPDRDLAHRYLRHPPREPEYRQGRPHREFMGSLEDMGLARGVEALRDLLDAELSGNLESLTGRFEL